MNRRARAFTLVEMMVVLTISLLLMSMILPVFKVSTKTVQVIERKLAVYEAARNLMELIEGDVQLAITNEKGEHWSLKNVSWINNDSFTPPSASPPLDPGLTDPTSQAFHQSRRWSDALNYVRGEGSGMPGGPRQFPGGKAFPTAYPTLSLNTPEVWKVSLRSTLLYQHDLEWYSQDYDSTQNLSRWNRDEQLADVSQIEMCIIYENMADQWRRGNFGIGGSRVQRNYDPIPQYLGPGNEIKIPPGYNGDMGSMRQRRLGQMKIMDLHISFWYDSPAVGGGKQFKDLPDNTVVYFWPPPKAIRITITVCDREKRDMVTLCRIMQIPIGSGDGVINTAAMDTAYYTPAHGVSTPAIFNRTKYLPKVGTWNSGNPDSDAPFNGDGSRGWSSDIGNCTENSIITQDPPAKPYNWP